MRLSKIGYGITVAVLLTGAASAQSPAQDPEIATYQQLLTEANSRLAGLNKLNQSLQAKIQELQKAAKSVDHDSEPAK